MDMLCTVFLVICVGKYVYLVLAGLGLAAQLVAVPPLLPAISLICSRCLFLLVLP